MATIRTAVLVPPPTMMKNASRKRTRTSATQKDSSSQPSGPGLAEDDEDAVDDGGRAGMLLMALLSGRAPSAVPIVPRPVPARQGRGCRACCGVRAGPGGGAVARGLGIGGG